MNDTNGLNYEIFDIDGLKLCVSNNFRFGTDAILLSRFVKPLPRHIVCDLCSGSGIIPFMLYKNEKRRPGMIYSLDIAEEAGILLNQSLKLSGITEGIVPITGDLKNTCCIPRESVDIVTVNPPYFKNMSGAKRKSPPQAAARHELFCTIDDVTAAAARLLKFGGKLVLCHKPSRLADVIVSMKNSGIEPKKLLMVSSKKEEVRTKPWLFLISGKKGAKPGLAVEHTYTEEVYSADD